MNRTERPWYSDLTRYHWFVLIVAALGWLFDTMDQQLFAMARAPAMQDLLHDVDKATQTTYATIATSIFLIGWATGGLFFGVLGDRYGRAKVMVWTILIYSLCTGLSAFSLGFWDFALYRFLTGLGVGGEFAVGVSLVAEVMPDRARPFALGLLQALSAVGNITAAVINMSMGVLTEAGAVSSTRSWRIMFLIGTVPALLALFVRRRLKEPDRWRETVLEQKNQRAGSYAEMFGDPRWRRNALVGVTMAFAGIVGLWGIGFFSFDLLRPVFEKHFQAQGLDPHVVQGRVGLWIGITSVVQNIGGFLGIYVYSRVTHRIGRRPAFAVAFILAMLSTMMVFGYLDQLSEVFWMIPIMGFCQLAIFGGYAIYFPELFPTRLRSTGTSFCYNVGRYIAAAGPFTLGILVRDVFSGYSEPMRYAGMSMSLIFLLGLAALPFAPETRGQPLPE